MLSLIVLILKLTCFRESTQELHFQNKRLLDANNDLKSQLESNEEQMSKLADQVSEANKTIRK